MSRIRTLFRSLPSGRFIKFGLVGGSGVFVNAGILHLLTAILGLNYRVSAIFAVESAIINNFLLNYSWTWRERRCHTPMSMTRAFLRYNVCAAGTAFVINYGLLILLTEAFDIHYQVSNLTGIAAGIGFNFILSHFWVFAVQNKR